MTKKINFIYFGGEPLGATVLKHLLAHDLRPRAVVTNPDRKSGRGRELTAPPTKVFAESMGIPVLQPISLEDEDFLAAVTGADVFVVVAFNKILPETFLSLPRHQTINLHPSLLPLYRGVSPIRTAILENARENIGFTIMLLDAEMDHGAILAQEILAISEEDWPLDGRLLDEMLAEAGGELLAETIPLWINGDIEPQEQQHEYATYTKKLTKNMGEMSLNPYALPEGQEAYDVLLRIRGLAGWPGTYFFYDDKRIIISAAHIKNNTLVIDRIIPEGKREMNFTDYFQKQ